MVRQAAGTESRVGQAERTTNRRGETIPQDTAQSGQPAHKIASGDAHLLRRLSRQNGGRGKIRQT